MTNLQWLASIPHEDAVEILSAMCPFRRPVVGACNDCPGLRDHIRCGATLEGMNAMQQWLLEEHEEESK